MDEKICTIEEMNSLCRTCLSFINNTSNMFKQKSSNGQTYASLLMECTSMQVLKDDGLPIFMCRKCIIYLESYIIFRETCIKSNITLKNIYNRISDTIKSEPLIDSCKSEPLIDSCKSEPLIDSCKSVPLIDSCKSETPDIVEIKIKSSGNNKKVKMFVSSEEDSKPVEKKYNRNVNNCYSLPEKIELKSENKNKKIEYKPVQPKVCHQNKKQSLYYKKKATNKLGGSKYKCEFCNKKFSVKSNLAPHRRIHTGEKPFTCITCGKSFTQKVNLQTHVKTHFKVQEDSLYKCNTCNEVFSRKSYFSHHRKMHHIKRTFACYICGISFSQKEMLEEHNHIHQENCESSTEICKIVQVCSLKTNNDLQYDYDEGFQTYNQDSANIEFEEVYI